MKTKRHLFVPVRTAPITLKRADGESPKIEGYGAVFYDENDPGTEYKLWDDYVERIMPGAFDDAISASADVRSLFNHDTNIVLGRSLSETLRLSVDKKGLLYSVDPPDTQAARDLVKSIERGDVTGSSFMFIPTDTVWREQDNLFIREIHGVELFEVGPVTFPAYEGTTSGVRSDEELAEFRKLVDARKQKMSKSQPDCRDDTDADDKPCCGCRQLELRLRGFEGRLKLLETP